MDISPQRVRTAEFKTVKKGLDPDEVRIFLDEVAAELERAQNQSTAMEARARAAVARLQEISETTPGSMAADASTSTVDPGVGDAAPAAEMAASVDQAETISRTLLLAQRTADTAIAEAEAEAARVRGAAEEEASRAVSEAKEMSERLANEARDEARRHGEAERIQVESEVNALLARRDFLESDVDHLQSFLVEERSRLRETAATILELVERVPGGLGEVRRPLLSAADDEVDPDAESAVDDTASAEPARTEETAVVDASVDASDAAPADGASEWSNASSDAADDDDQLVIQTDIADEGPTGFSYDDQNR